MTLNGRNAFSTLYVMSYGASQAKFNEYRTVLSATSKNLVRDTARQLYTSRFCREAASNDSEVIKKGSYVLQRFQSLHGRNLER